MKLLTYGNRGHKHSKSLKIKLKTEPEDKQGCNINKSQVSTSLLFAEKLWVYCRSAQIRPILSLIFDFLFDGKKKNKTGQDRENCDDILWDIHEACVLVLIAIIIIIKKSLIL